MVEDLTSPLPSSEQDLIAVAVVAGGGGRQQLKVKIIRNYGIALRTRQCAGLWNILCWLMMTLAAAAAATELFIA